MPDHRSGFRGSRLVLHIHFQRPRHHNDDLFVLVLVLRMGLLAGAQYGFMHFYVEAAVRCAEKKSPRLLIVIAAVGDLRVMIDLTGQHRRGMRWAPLGLLLSGTRQYWKKYPQVSA
jgi:hypothetical protein